MTDRAFRWPNTRLRPVTYNRGRLRAQLKATSF